MTKSVWAKLVMTNLVLGCSAESEIRKKAEFVCRHISLESPTLVALPEGTKAQEYLRPEDHQFLQEQEKAGDAGLAAAMKVALLPAIRAVAEARAAFTTCEVSAFTQRDGRATVTIRETTPKPPSESLAVGLDRLGEVNKLDTHSARVKKAKEWFAQSTEKMTAERSVVVVKTEAGWLVDLQLPEKAKQAADLKSRESQLESLLAGAAEALRDCGVTEARARLAEAERLMPDSPAIASGRVALEDRAKGCIGGKWYRTSKRDEMTDDLNVTVLLNSENEINGSYKSSKAVLVARCAERRLELFISTDSILDDTFQVGLEGRYRFGNSKAERIVFSRSTDMKGAFFRNTEAWLTTLAAKKDEVLAIELPVYGTGPAVVQFKLSGFDKAITELAAGCPR